MESGWILWSYKIILHCNIFPSKKCNTIDTYVIWQERDINLTACPNMDSNKPATMRHAIIKNKHLSEMEIDKIKLKVQSKCETNNRLQNNFNHFKKLLARNVKKLYISYSVFKHNYLIKPTKSWTEWGFRSFLFIKSFEN